MSMERRVFLRTLGAVGGGAMLPTSLAGLVSWNGSGATAGPDGARRSARPFIEPYGPLVPSPDCPD